MSRPTPSGTLVAQRRPGGVADHDLDAAAADVDAQRGRGLEHEAGAHRGEDQPGLLDAR